MKKKSRKQHSSINFSKILKILFLGILIFVAYLILVAGKMLFSVRDINCKLSNDAACPEHLLAELEVLKNKPIFFTDYKSILSKENALSQPYSITQVTKTLPSTLNIIFTAEDSLFIIEQSSQSYLISSSGKVFPNDQIQSEQAIVKVITDNTLVENNQIDSGTFHTISTILTTGDELDLPIQSITWVDKSTIKLNMKEITEVAIIDSESPRLELQKLTNILSSKEYQTLPETKQELDLRFRMPVLRTTP